MAPRARFELATLRLTAECSAVELPGSRLISGMTQIILRKWFTHCNSRVSEGGAGDRGVEACVLYSKGADTGKSFFAKFKLRRMRKNGTTEVFGWWRRGRSDFQRLPVRVGDSGRWSPGWDEAGARAPFRGPI
jgi:hypothetical protein